MGRDESACALAQYEMNGDEIGAPEEFLFFNALNAKRVGALRPEILAPGDHLHLKSLADSGNLGAQPAKPSHAQYLSTQSHPERALPSSTAHAAILARNVARQTENQSPGQLHRWFGQHRSAGDDD